eukprot:5799417-Prymnesium_polylepis.1
MPLRLLSKGSAASATSGLIDAAPSARKPMPTHGIRCSDDGLSAEMTTTRRQRPLRIQSMARASAA